MLRIGYKPGFIRAYKKLPAALRTEVQERIALFSKDPKHPTLRVHKLKGALRQHWSFSVNYAYRVIFIYQDKHTAVLLMVGDHSVYE